MKLYSIGFVDYGRVPPFIPVGLKQEELRETTYVVSLSSSCPGGKKIAQYWKFPCIIVRDDIKSKKAETFDITTLCPGGEGLLISKKALDSMKDLLYNCEMLEFSNNKDYVAINVLPRLDCLREKESFIKYSIKTYPDKKKGYSLIYKYVFDINKIEGYDIFMIRNYHEIIVSSNFKAAIEKYGLNTVSLRLIWDSENPEFVDERWTDVQKEAINSSFKNK